MSKNEEFLKFFDELLVKCDPPIEMSENVKEVYEMLKNLDLKSEKPIVTELGLQIINYMQNNEIKSFKAKEIAEQMGISSKRISGAMNKLVNDGYFEKVNSGTPIIYSITQKGKEFKLN